MVSASSSSASSVTATARRRVRDASPRTEGQRLGGNTKVGALGGRTGGQHLHGERGGGAGQVTHGDRHVKHPARDALVHRGGIRGSGRGGRAEGNPRPRPVVVGEGDGGGGQRACTVAGRCSEGEAEGFVVLHQGVVVDAEAEGGRRSASRSEGDAGRAGAVIRAGPGGAAVGPREPHRDRGGRRHVRGNAQYPRGAAPLTDVVGRRGEGHPAHDGDDGPRRHRHRHRLDGQRGGIIGVAARAHRVADGGRARRLAAHGEGLRSVPVARGELARGRRNRRLARCAARGPDAHVRRRPGVQHHRVGGRIVLRHAEAGRGHRHTAGGRAVGQVHRGGGRRSRRDPPRQRRAEGERQRLAGLVVGVGDRHHLEGPLGLGSAELHLAGHGVVALRRAGGAHRDGHRNRARGRRGQAQRHRRRGPALDRSVGGGAEGCGDGWRPAEVRHVFAYAVQGARCVRRTPYTVRQLHAGDAEGIALSIGILLVRIREAHDPRTGEGAQRQAAVFVGHDRPPAVGCRGAGLEGGLVQIAGRVREREPPVVALAAGFGMAVMPKPHDVAQLVGKGVRAVVLGQEVSEPLVRVPLGVGQTAAPVQECDDIRRVLVTYPGNLVQVAIPRHDHAVERPVRDERRILLQRPPVDERDARVHAALIEGPVGLRDAEIDLCPEPLRSGLVVVALEFRQDVGRVEDRHVDHRLRFGRAGVCAGRDRRQPGLEGGVPWCAQFGFPRKHHSEVFEVAQAVRQLAAQATVLADAETDEIRQVRQCVGQRATQGVPREVQDPQ